jgi:hypothetical protein
MLIPLVLLPFRVNRADNFHWENIKHSDNLVLRMDITIQKTWRLMPTGNDIVPMMMSFHQYLLCIFMQIAYGCYLQIILAGVALIQTIWSYHS